MNHPILLGLDTEYGIWIEGKSVESQIEDSTDFLRACPLPALKGWDYRSESPRQDLRGGAVSALAYDPVDAQFDQGRSYGPRESVHANHILTNGARFYNDHGHPEYATPECLTPASLAAHDLHGDFVLRETARAYEQAHGRAVKIYKNTSDFSGASWGAHESYLVPRDVPYGRLYAHVVPVLVARILLTGAGKVGSEAGAPAAYQLSQRADFFMEAANPETLYRRPVFNTRDEPHADRSDFIRLHVIAGDANRMACATARRVGLVRLALRVMTVEPTPVFTLADPVRAIQAVSRHEAGEARIALTGDRWTTAEAILLDLFDRADRFLELEPHECDLIAECRTLLEQRRSDFPAFARRVDWAAKRLMLEEIMTELGTDWRDPTLRSYDMAYHDLDPEESLFDALVLMGRVDANPPMAEAPDSTRALARGLAVERFLPQLESAAWEWITFRGQAPLRLQPDIVYSAQVVQNLRTAPDVGTFMNTLRGETR